MLIVAADYPTSAPVTSKTVMHHELQVPAMSSSGAYLQKVKASGGESGRSPSAGNGILA